MLAYLAIAMELWTERGAGTVKILSGERVCTVSRRRSALLKNNQTTYGAIKAPLNGAQRERRQSLQPAVSCSHSSAPLAHVRLWSKDARGHRRSVTGALSVSGYS
jgi:hypothetical protein